MTRNKAFIFIFCLCVTALLSTAFTFYYLDEKQIHGTILDATSGRPIAGAILQIDAIQIVSNQYGRFHTKLGRANGILLAANAPGYLPTSFTFDMPWYLRTGHVTINLTPLELSLRVVDSWTDAPMENLIIQIGDSVYQTDQAGMVNLTVHHLELPLLITINHPGYSPKQMKLRRLPNSSVESPLIVDLEPHVLAGFVVAKDTQQPLAEVTVTAGDDSLRTDKDGRFFLFRLQSGDFISVLPSPEFLPAEFFFAGQETVTVALSPRQIRVDVVDALSSLPIVGARIQIQNQANLTNSRGEVRLQRVPAQGTLLVSHPVYYSRTVTYHSGQSTTITLTPTSARFVVRDAHTALPLTYTQASLNGIPFTVGRDGRYQLTSLGRAVNLRFKQAGYKPAQLTINFETDFEITTENLAARPCETDSSLQPSCLDLFLHPFSAKAVYVPFNLLSRPDKIRAIFDLVDQTELNAVILDVKGDRGLLAWDSQIEQANLLGIDGNREDWMALETFLAEAQARDIYTIARMVIFKDNPLAFGNPDLAIAYANGTIWLDGEGLAWVNPFREEVWAYNIALAEEIAAMGFDEVNLDYLRFPSDGDIEAIAFPQENTLETRTAAIRTFTSLMKRAVAPYGTYLSADVFGLTVWVDPENDMNIGQRVIDIAPYVDYLSPMIYPSTFAPGNLGLANPVAHPYDVIFRSQRAAMERVPATTHVRPWLQAYWYNVNDMLLQKQAAIDANADGWLWWNAAGVYDQTIFRSN